MNYFNTKFRIVLQWVILIVSAAVLLFVLYSSVRSFEILRQNGNIRPMRRHLLSGSLLQPSPQQLQGWMTFHYINVTFKLPQDYLKNTLQIKNDKYPNLSLDALAKQNKVNSGDMLAKTKKALEDYINSHPAAIK